jgi:hypothetical protein
VALALLKAQRILATQEALAQQQAALVAAVVPVVRADAQVAPQQPMSAEAPLQQATREEMQAPTLEEQEVLEDLALAVAVAVEALIVQREQL